MLRRNRPAPAQSTIQAASNGRRRPLHRRCGRMFEFTYTAITRKVVGRFTYTLHEKVRYSIRDRKPTFHVNMMITAELLTKNRRDGRNSPPLSSVPLRLLKSLNADSDRRTRTAIADRDSAVRESPSNTQAGPRVRTYERKLNTEHDLSVVFADQMSNISCKSIGLDTNDIVIMHTKLTMKLLYQFQDSCKCLTFSFKQR